MCGGFGSLGGWVGGQNPEPPPRDGTTPAEFEFLFCLVGGWLGGRGVGLLGWVGRGSNQDSPLDDGNLTDFELRCFVDVWVGGGLAARVGGWGVKTRLPHSSMALSLNSNSSCCVGGWVGD